MAYNKKYNFTFAYGHSENLYELAVYEDSWAGSVTQLIPANNPCTHAILGEESDEDVVIFGSQITFNFLIEDTDKDDYDDEFLSIEYKEKIVKLIKDPLGTPSTKFVGIILPESSYREYENYLYTYTIMANDGLADLRSLYYTSSGKDNGNVYTGFDNMLSILKKAISKVADISDLQLPLKVQLGIFSDQMTSTENAFKESEIVQELFYNDDGNRVVQTASEVISKILTPFTCNLIQWDSNYQIFNYNEIDSYVFLYDWSTLTQQSRTSFDRELTPNTDIESPGTLYKRPAISVLLTTLFNKEYVAELLDNPGFETSTINWSNGAAGGGESWTSFSWYNHPVVGGTASLSWGGAATDGDYSIHSDSFTLDTSPGAGNVNVTLRMAWVAVTSSGGTPPNVEMNLHNATDGYVTGTVGAQTFTSMGGFITFTETFGVIGLGNTTNELNIQVQVQDATTTGIQFYIDYVTLTQESATSEPSDWSERAVLQTGTQKGIRKNELYIADQKETANDISAIKDSGGNYTETWTRYGKTEDIPLIQAYQQNYMNNNSFYADYVTVSFYDPSDLFQPHLAIYDSGTSKTYRIIGYEKVFRDATVNVQLREIKTTDGTFVFNSSKLTTIYGS